MINAEKRNLHFLTEELSARQEVCLMTVLSFTVDSLVRVPNRLSNERYGQQNFQSHPCV
jgi:hypothetical protein